MPLFASHNVEKLKARSDIDGLIRLLSHEKYRDSAVAALADMGPAAAQPLLSVLGHKNSLTRAGGAEALGKIGDRRAVGSLITALTNESRMTDESRAVAKTVLRALSTIGDPAGSRTSSRRAKEIGVFLA